MRTFSLRFYANTGAASVALPGTVEARSPQHAARLALGEARAKVGQAGVRGPAGTVALLDEAGRVIFQRRVAG